VRKQLACGPGVSLQNAASAVRFVSAGTPIPTPSQASAAFSGIRWNAHVYGPRRELFSHANQQCRASRMNRQSIMNSMSTTTSTSRSEAKLLTLLDLFADAWNRHDLDALMSMMTDDCVFEASAGPRVDGQRSEGKQAVRAAYAAVFEAFPDAHWGNARHFIVGDRGVSEWTFTGTQKDGKRVEVNGCDLFTFRDGKIALKNSYRKNRLSS